MNNDICTNEHDYDMKLKQKGIDLAKEVTDALNNFSNGVSRRAFLKAMTREHPTLQQSFTGLCLEWLATIAAEDYCVDGRNEYAQKIARKALKDIDISYEINMPYI